MWYEHYLNAANHCCLSLFGRLDVHKEKELNQGLKQVTSRQPRDHVGFSNTPYCPITVKCNVNLCTGHPRLKALV